MTQAPRPRMSMPEFSEAMAQFEQAYPKFQLSSDSLVFWNQKLCHFRPDTIRTAIDRHIKSSKFEPRIADVAELCLAIEGKGTAVQLRVSDSQRKQDQLDMEAHGFLKVSHQQGYHYEPESDLVRHAGKWKRKIDFVMDVLGPPKVTAELKAITAGNSWTGLLAKTDWVAKYKEKLDDLVGQAHRALGPPQSGFNY